MFVLVLFLQVELHLLLQVELVLFFQELFSGFTPATLRGIDHEAISEAGFSSPALGHSATSWLPEECVSETPDAI